MRFASTPFNKQQTRMHGTNNRNNSGNTIVFEPTVYERPLLIQMSMNTVKVWQYKHQVVPISLEKN